MASDGITDGPHADLTATRSVFEQTADNALGATLTATGRPELPISRARHDDREVELEPGAIIGRYVVLTTLGAGAMGIVFAAYDPELDRKVALKLIKRGRTSRSEASQLRLQREAQALAKLVHPHVVAVHDVGVHDGQLFVAMEFVAGQTLTQWTADGEREIRPWPEVIEVLAAAGEGLAAAHDVGLVHRDFKPDNVMIGDDGRVRVMDFGLARTQTELHSSEDIRSGEDLAQVLAESSGSAARLTRTGAVIGTPAYMATEQFDGRLADARSDQFGFCVALYKTLYGERPFAGATLGELMAAVRAGEVRPPPADADVPGWVRKIVVTGLSPAPEDRHPSMRVLLRALRSNPWARWRRVSVALGAIAIATGVIAGAVHVLTPSPPPTCTGTPERVGAIWNSDTREAIDAAFEATQMSYASDSAARVGARIDAYTAAWVDARVDACEATQRGDQSERLLDLRMACLDRRLWDLDALLEVLRGADRAVVIRSVEATAALPALAHCADGLRLDTELATPEDPELARAVASVEERMATIGALDLAGRYADAARLTDALLAEAAPLDYAPLTARLRLRRATIALNASEFEAARDQLELAYDQGLSLGMLDVAAAAAADLVWVTGESLADHEGGRAWAVHAAPLAAAVGTDEARGHFLVNLGNVAWAEAEYEEAATHNAEVLALRERAEGPEALSLAAPLLNLGNVAWALARYEDAAAYYQRVLTLQERHLGAHHPNLANTLNNLGSLAAMQSDYAQAERYLSRTLEIWTESLGPDSVQVSHCRYNLANVLISLDQPEAARTHALAALEIRRVELGPAHPDVAASVSMLGDLARDDGQLELAEDRYREALAIKTAALGPDHPKLAFTLNALGQVLDARGQPAAAREVTRRALAIREATYGPDHVLLRGPLGNLAASALEAGDPAAALRDYRRALAIAEAHAEDPLTLARLRFGVARSLAALGREPGRVDELVANARSLAAQAGPDGDALLAAIETWSEARPGSTPAQK